MMNLYRLTMDLIGKDIRPNVKLEKVDVLGTCYNVFEYIAAMISQQPELQAKLRRSTKKLRMQLRALSDQKRRSNVRKGSDMCKVNENRVAQFSWSDFPNGNSAFFPVPGASGTHPAAFGRLTTHSTPLIQGMYGGRPISKHESFDFNVCNNPPTPIHQHSISRLQPMCVHDVACLPCLSIDHRGFSRSHSPLTFQLDSGIDTITVHRSISCYESAHGPSDCYSHPTIWRPYLD
ncbi:hypothetical protein PHET_01424 [Paragonimus heterotremus]|uniref:Uncharacterized protein n=1 Tax=Paragonimus heterotremus TaxID=100268 RepID=A0A8J4TRG5_9TREM|nr:hypothetical protein PHET_01424 [Paragonimus heterotremus]